LETKEKEGRVQIFFFKREGKQGELCTITSIELKKKRDKGPAASVRRGAKIFNLHKLKL